MSADPLDRVEGVAAVVLRENINTDIIAPPARAGLRDRFGEPRDGAHRVFGPWRYDEEGSELADFVLNRTQFRSAPFLIAGKFRVWKLARNRTTMAARVWRPMCRSAKLWRHLLRQLFPQRYAPLALPQEVVERLASSAEQCGRFVLDVSAGSLFASDGALIYFSLPSFRRSLLLSGGDELAITLAQGNAIDAYQARARLTLPWIWPTTPTL